jgi:DNA-binding NarL/FixJ family response regulator
MPKPYKQPFQSVGDESAAQHPAATQARARILLADDHTILREGVRAILEIERDFEVVGEASTVEDAVELSRLLQPDVVIIDVSFPEGSGIQAIGRLRRASAGVRVLILTVHNSQECRRAALTAGADAYVVKDAPIENLVAAIRTSISQNRPSSKAAPAAHVEPLLPNMTVRESEIMIGIALGYSSKKIAENLGLSAKTIDKHRSQMMRKLGLHNSAAVTRFAMANGFMLSEAEAQAAGTEN